MSQNESTSKRSVRDIESSLDNTRMRIDHTLERLEDRIRPSALVDQAWRYARSKRDDGTASRLQETVVHNPLPVALIGVGLAWLLLAGRDGSVAEPESPLAEGHPGQSHASDASDLNRDNNRGTGESRSAVASNTPDGSNPSSSKPATSKDQPGSQGASSSANSGPGASGSLGDKPGEDAKPEHSRSSSTETHSTKTRDNTKQL